MGKVTPDPALPRNPSPDCRLQYKYNSKLVNNTSIGPDFQLRELASPANLLKTGPTLSSALRSSTTSALTYFDAHPWQKVSIVSALYHCLRAQPVLATRSNARFLPPVRPAAAGDTGRHRPGLRLAELHPGSPGRCLRGCRSGGLRLALRHRVRQRHRRPLAGARRRRNRRQHRRAPAAGTAGRGHHHSLQLLRQRQLHSARRRPAALRRHRPPHLQPLARTLSPNSSGTRLATTSRPSCPSTSTASAPTSTPSTRSASDHPGLLLIEDAAQAFGAAWTSDRPAGSARRRRRLQLLPHQEPRRLRRRRPGDHFQSRTRTRAPARSAPTG